MPQLAHISAQLDRIAEFDPGPFPLISLYLNLQSNERGRESFEPFLRKELTERLRTYPPHGPEHESLEQDAAKIREYVAGVDRSMNGLALFAASGAGFFEPIPLAAPIDTHRLSIASRPHLYPLARLLDEYPRYLALLSDTHSARIFVFALNTLERRATVDNTKVKHHKQGGWAQARFQRHVENFHLQHAKEVVDAVVRIVRDDRIDRVIVSADEAILPTLQAHYPKDLAERIVDIVRLDVRAPEREVLETTVAALRERDAETDRERVDALVTAYRSGGLACVGEEQVRAAFELGQVDELVVTAAPPDERAWDDMIGGARRTAATVRFIEDPSLLAPVGGIGAFLRFAL
jgi:peptide subunit release factor 1 (eRF1)